MLRAHVSLCIAISAFCLITISCGGGAAGGTKITAEPPIFTTTPPSTAAQSTAYSYSIAATDPSGGSVTFALTTGPTGASLSGDTLTWTPTAAQSRASNNFTVTATSSENATASQSWTVSPTGIVTVNWINTYWEPSGPVQFPVMPAAGLEISAVVPESDGSFTVLKSASASPGVFTIAGVPAGNYWLTLGPIDLLPSSSSAYWTSASTIDIGHDLAGTPPAILNSIITTVFDLNLSGLDSVTEQTPLLFQPENQTLTLPLPLAADTSSADLTLTIEGNIDWSQVSELFLGQYEPQALAPLNNAVLGPSVLLTDQSFVNSSVNPLTETFSTTPASLPLAIQGSQWSALLTGAEPAAPTSYASAFSLVAEPYVTGINAPGGAAGPDLTLAATSTTTGIIFALEPFGSTCDAPGFPFIPFAAPAITTDQTLGSLNYSDPFDSSWTRAESFCEEALVPIPIPNSTTTANFALVDSSTTAPTKSPIAPIVSAVQQPTINGASLYTAATLTTTTPALAWTAPSTGAPYGYRITAFVEITADNITTYQIAGVFNTSQTTTTLPPLSAGNTYVFSIAAEVDGAANVQASPFRSALPTGSASVVSAPITISNAAAQPVIRGDARVIRRFSEPATPPKNPVKSSGHLTRSR
jgi:hypothetical protein